MENEVEVYMDSFMVSTGNNVTGEIFVHCSSGELAIKIAGKEKVSITKSTGETWHNTVKIFNHYEKIWDVESGQKAIFPFCFRLPYHIPATFHFLKEDDKGNLIEASIRYKVKAEVLCVDKLISDCKILTIYGNSASPYQVPNTLTFKEISNCFCFPAGLASLEISMISPCTVDNSHAKFAITCKELPHNSRILEITGKTIYVLSITLPDNTYHFNLELNETVQESNSLEFCGDITKKFGENHCTTESSMISSCYKVEASVRFSFGCKVHEVQSALAFNVGPILVKSPQHSYLIENTKEFAIIHIVLVDSFGDAMCSSMITYS